MLKITFELEDIKGNFEAVGDGNWKLTASDSGSGEQSHAKIVSTHQMCCILYSMHDEVDPVIGTDQDSVTVYSIAARALKNFPVQLIP